ncbi:MAG: hypothetical protein J6X16_02440 [Bacteroidales bacterium]|nr:hypothetical protein [Bacteroidales bacterium]
MEESKLYVSSMGKWMKFFAVLMTIALVFMALGCIGIVSFGSHIPMEVFGGLSLKWFGFLYLIMIILYVFPTLYLYRSSAAAQLAVEANDNEQVVEFLKNNKSFWKFCGILTIVMLCTYVVAIIGIIIAAIAMGMPMM